MKLRKGLALVLALGMMTAMVGCNSGNGASGTDIPDGPIVLEVNEVKNIILFIGDGMGPEQVKFGEIMKESKLSFQDFPYFTQVDTNSLDGLGGRTTTDSAAAATALATGVLTTNGRVGLGPTHDEELETIMDVAQKMGKRTGVITTENLNGATPMGFSAHAGSRNNTIELVNSAAQSGINFFASDVTGNRNYFIGYGYSVLANLEEYEGYKTKEKIFCNMQIKAGVEEDNSTYETFHETVATALDFLSQDKDGFVLMAEGAHIDHGGHNNDINYMVEELLAFDLGVEEALRWAYGRTDTVVIVTADHETGDLHLRDGITKDNYRAMETVDGFEYSPVYYYWGSKSHSNAEVGFYVNGKDIDFKSYSEFGVASTIKNTAVFDIMKDLLENKI